MTKDSPTFGSAISRARKGLKLTQKDLAAKITTEEGKAISPQYLNDIEHDRRSPSSGVLVAQFAKVLALDADYLYFLAGRIPEDVREMGLNPAQAQNAMKAFRRTVDKKKS